MARKTPLVQFDTLIYQQDGEEHRLTGSFAATMLPVPLLPLLGREQEVVEVQTLLHRSDVHVLTLTGAGGIGKTSLALHVAAIVRGMFADGACWMSLASIRDPSLVLPIIAQTLGLKDVGKQAVLDLLKGVLRDRHLLLLLDNFEQVVSAAPLLSELVMDCPLLKVLVTSREVLRLSHEVVFSVPPLVLPDLKHLPEREALSEYAAVALFLQHTQMVNPDFQLTASNASVIAEICARLDGLPLAIELAAARIRLLSAQQLLQLLKRRLQVLTGGPRDVPERQQTMRNTIAWSYNLLTGEEQRLFQQLSVFVGGCQVETLGAVSHAVQEQKTDVVPTVLSLIEKSLVRQIEQEGEESRVTMLETVREYGLEILVANGRMEVIRQAHARYYVALAEEGEPHLKGAQQLVWLRRLEREHGNLRAALQWLLEHRETVLALRLCGALGRFWDLRGYWSEGRSWIEAVLVLPQAGMPTVERAKALRSAGELAYSQDDYPVAHRMLEESVALSQGLEDKQELVAALGSLWLLEAQEGFLAVRPLCEESVARCYKLEGRWERARLLEKLGQVALLQRDTVRATALIGESLTLARELGDRSLIARALHRLAVLASIQGDLTQEEALVGGSLALARELDDKAVIALCYETLTYLALYQGDLTQAMTYSQESLALGRQLGDKSHIAVALNNGSNIALRQGDLIQAERLTQESLALNRELGDQVATAYTLHTLADIAWRQGNVTRAATLFREGLPLAQQHGHSALIGWYLLGLGRVAEAEGQLLQAAHLLSAAEARLNVNKNMDPVERATYEREVAHLRAQLGEEAFQAAWNVGRTMPPEQAVAALEVTSTPAVNQSSFPDDLTAREVDVLRLVATGLTNGQIAERLVISPLTVNAHLRSIYSKLDIPSRAAATRYAFEHHLV